MFFVLFWLILYFQDFLFHDISGKITLVNQFFIPIHKFVPKIQTNVYDGLDSDGNGGKYVSEFGPERYIGLTNGLKNNYE